MDNERRSAKLCNTQTSNMSLLSLLSTLQRRTPFVLIPSNPLCPPSHLSSSLRYLASTRTPPSLSSSSFPLHSSSPKQSSPSLSSSSSSDDDDDDDDDDHAVGGCLIFEDGIFEDPFLEKQLNPSPTPDSTAAHIPKIKKTTPKAPEIVPQNLVPEDWQRALAEINITKKERRKIAQELEYGRRLDRKTKGLQGVRTVNLEEYLKYRDEKLSQSKQGVVDNSSGYRWTDEGKGEDDSHGDDEGEGDGVGGDRSGNTNATRVEPKNLRWAVYGRGLDDISTFFNSGKYQPGDATKSGGPTKLFTKEERDLLNARVPKLAVATSANWLPLHGIAASGDFDLLNSMLKHTADINATDREGSTALHKAIICKKQDITNCLLRESANPFVRDKDGATLMHYAVRTASIQAIKTLLLYNVDINLQDNDGWTPLHLAVQARRTDVVRFLLLKGADKTLKNKDGLTPLDLCLYSGRDKNTYLLIKLLKEQLLPKQPLHQKIKRIHRLE